MTRDIQTAVYYTSNLDPESILIKGAVAEM